MRNEIGRALRMFLSTPVIYKFGITLIISCQVLLIYLGYLLFFPLTPLMVKNAENLKVAPKTVQPGEPFGIFFDYCKDKYYKTTVSKTVVGDTQVYNLPVTDSNVLPTGCHKLYVKHMVPRDIASGKYYVSIEVDYLVNPVRTIHYSLKTEPFFVEGGDK